jgi:hypothetical protein
MFHLHVASKKLLPGYGFLFGEQAIDQDWRTHIYASRQKSSIEPGWYNYRL